jgi:hypothetical protein
MSVVLMVLFAFLMFQAKQEEAWPHVIGRITNGSSYLDLGRKQWASWKAKFEYEYYVNGVKYTGTTESSKQHQLEASNEVSLHPINSRIPVYYPPSNPAKSTLAPARGFWGASYALLFSFGIFILSPILSAFVFDRNKN